MSVVISGVDGDVRHLHFHELLSIDVPNECANGNDKILTSGLSSKIRATFMNVCLRPWLCAEQGSPCEMHASVHFIVSVVSICERV